MSYANRKHRYETDKDNKVNHLLTDALRKEFEVTGSAPPKEFVTPDPDSPTGIKEKIYTEEQLFDLVKAEQAVILNNYGITKIPTTEPERVAKILEMQNV